MAKAVRILGTAYNLSQIPLPHPEGVEVWCANDPKGYKHYLQADVVEAQWTRWFNLHSRRHMAATYPRRLAYFLGRSDTRPFYTQKFWPDIPGCIAFPRDTIQEYFKTSAGPNRFFTCSVCWMIALAIVEGFDRIELWGFQLSDRKPGGRYVFERPCFFYWVQQARDRGLQVTYQAEVAQLPFAPGDPDTYDGPLYGYDTKPEPDE
jgi:hypothetical protein